jgi:hypothetical protein
LREKSIAAPPSSILPIVPLIPTDGDSSLPEPRRAPLVPAVTFAVVRGEVVKQQTYAQPTPHRGTAAMREVWIRTGAGEDTRLVLEADKSPALEGHTLSVVTGTTADGTVHPLHVRNHSTGQMARMEFAIRKVAGDDESLGCMVPIGVALLGLPVWGLVWWFISSTAAELMKYLWIMAACLSRWVVLAITRPARQRRIAAVAAQVDALAALA